MPRKTGGAPSGRERILQAAAEVFAERGYEGARVQAIAKRAGMTTGAIYAHFSGRHDLLVAATDLHASTVAQEQHDAMREAPVAEIFAAIGPQLAANPDLGMRPLAMEALVAARREPQLREMMRTKVEASNDEIAALIARGQQEGVITNDVDPDTAAKFFNSLLVGVAALAPIWQDPLSQEHWPRLFERIRNALKPSASTPAPGPG